MSSHFSLQKLLNLFCSQAKDERIEGKQPEPRAGPRICSAVLVFNIRGF